jgi:hypothetical protein
MKPVPLPRFDYDVVQMLRHLLGLASSPAVMALLRGEQSHTTITPQGLAVLQDTIAKRLIEGLIQAGGWRDDHCLIANEVHGGRIWQRHDINELKLSFSPAPLSFLIWLTAENPARSREGWRSTGVAPTAADHFFFACIAEPLQRIAEIWSVLRRTTLFSDNPLLRLMQPAEFDAPLPDFTSFMQPAGSIILECLQYDLVHRWVEQDRERRGIVDWERLRREGERAGNVAHAYLSCCNAHHRRDLAMFVLDAIARAIGDDTPELTRWTGALALSEPARIADRIATRRAALALPAQMSTFAAWARDARAVRHFDDDYTAAQWWKARYEAYDGNRLALVAETLLRSTDPLQQDTA